MASGGHSKMAATPDSRIYSCALHIYNSVAAIDWPGRWRTYTCAQKNWHALQPQVALLLLHYSVPVLKR